MHNTLKAIGLSLMLLGTACTPYMEGAKAVTHVPDLVGDDFVTADGAKLPLRVWEPDEPAQAVLIGVHGFNDYGNFLMPGMPAFLQKNKIKLITYDQRGFGKGPHPGIWAGTQTMTNDLAMLIHLVHARHENLPLFVLGESMGGAVALTTLAKITPLPVDGLILSAPAVWGPSTWPWYQKAALYTMSYTLPWLKLSGGGIVQPTDNIETWKNWSRDPLVIKSTRVDALWGVSWLMEDALNAATDLKVPTLMLYGEKDQVIPKKATAAMVAHISDNIRLSLYKEGWHWLPRDKNAPVVWQDIVHWMQNKDVPLPSGADQEARKRLLEK
jgi:alpha-beta hydrolase superfamily lysophospholipase